jgi:hypothetical protein
VYCARCKPFDEIVAVKKLDLDASCNYDLVSTSSSTSSCSCTSKRSHTHLQETRFPWMASTAALLQLHQQERLTAKTQQQARQRSALCQQTLHCQYIEACIV